MPRFSVIVLNWNGRELLRGCLASIAAQDFSDHETIVVDNGSNDGSCELVEREHPEMRLIRVGENTGFCRGNNIGMEVATGELIGAVGHSIR